MPRGHRSESQSGYFHIIMRGVNKQDIFLDKKDYDTFLSFLREYLVSYHIDIVAYCLMTNHVHMIIHTTNESYSNFMRMLNARYAKYFNFVHDRTGHLFQNRYSMHIIGSLKYLLICIRYVHNNPPKAGISPASEYPWSSYPKYLSASWCLSKTGNTEQSDDSTNDVLCDYKLIQELFSDREQFIEFHKHCNLPSELALENFESQKAAPDSEVKDVICLLLKSKDPSSIQSLKLADRNNILQKLKAIGIKNSQICRITGLTRSVVSHSG